MDFAKLLEILFFPSNVVFIVFLILIYSSFALMSLFDLFVYGLAVVGFPFSFYIMNKRARRKNRAALISILLTLLSFTLLSLIFESLRNLRFLYLSVFAFLVLGLLVFLIRLNWKISLHVSVLTSSLTILTIFNNAIYPFYLFVPLVAWSRVRLKAHTINQTIAGFLLGLAMPLLLF